MIYFLVLYFYGLCSGGDFNVARFPEKISVTLTQAPEVTPWYNFTPSYYDLEFQVVSIKNGVSYPAVRSVHITQWEGHQETFPVSSSLVFVTIRIKPEKGSPYVLQKKIGFAQMGIQ